MQWERILFIELEVSIFEDRPLKRQRTVATTRRQRLGTCSAMSGSPEVDKQGVATRLSILLKIMQPEKLIGVPCTRPSLLACFELTV